MLRCLSICLLLATGAFTTQAWSHPVVSVEYQIREGELEVRITGGATQDTPFAIASVGKMFTSTAILLAQEEGVLDVDDLAADHLPAEIVAGFEGMPVITLRHMLTMTSGLPDYYDAGFVVNVWRGAESVANSHQAATHAFDAPDFGPGERYAYSNTNYLLLGLILERVYGQSYADVIDRLILTPVRMSDSFVFGSQPLPDAFPRGHRGLFHVRDYYTSTGFGDGGLIASPADLHRFFDALFLEKRLLPPAALAQMLTPAPGTAYGFGIIPEGPMLWHSGGDLGFSSLAAINTATGDIAIALSGTENADHDWVYDMWE